MRILFTLLTFCVVGHLTGQTPSLLQGECFWDTDPGTGNGIALSAFDGAFQDPFEQAIAISIPPNEGLHKLSVRLKGADGSWGNTYSTVVDAILMRDPQLVQDDMHWDIPPDTSDGFSIAAVDGIADDAFEEFATQLLVPPPGPHVLSVRVKGSDGSWGSYVRTIVDVVAKRDPFLTAGEYFWDVDPGEGNGRAMLPDDGAWNSASEGFSAVDNGAMLAPGPHVLHVRARDPQGIWGAPIRSVVHMDALPTIGAQLDVRVALQGCMGTGALMSNALRNQGLVPLSEPYTGLGFALGDATGTATSPSVMSVAFPPGASVVDWILFDLYPSYAPEQLALRLPLLLRRGGTVSDASGAYPFNIALPGGLYHAVIRHRNHLPIAAAQPLQITSSGAIVPVDLTATNTATLGSNSTVLTGSLFCMWAGDVNRDGSLKYTGTTNDRDRILTTIGGTTPNSTLAGYRSEDVNMDGSVKYTGTSNDRDPILVNVGSTTPNNVRSAQLP